GVPRYALVEVEVRAACDGVEYIGGGAAIVALYADAMYGSPVRLPSVPCLFFYFYLGYFFSVSK
ncbi:MAG: hypothetical protein QM530_06030, partial [Phycisphaerales bacterium]|nr:hypothetical protein [Phycisphaerales bacterium]